MRTAEIIVAPMPLSVVKPKNGAAVDSATQRLALSCAAPIDRNHFQIDSNLQKRHDLAAAQRRQLQRRVGPNGGHGAWTGGQLCALPRAQTAERPGMRLPDEAYAARLNEPSDEACAATTT